MPLSICSGMSVAVNALQSLQVCATFCGMGSCLTLSGCTRNCKKKPADACHAMWQLCALVSGNGSLAPKYGNERERMFSKRAGRYSLEWPDSCVVGVKLHHDVPVRADLLDVTTLRVVGVHDGAVPGQTWALGQDVHVEPVEVNRVTVEQC